MRIGMVMAGGGARGAYQIGVWKALEQLKVAKHIKVISGTSIGALNAILFVQGNLELAEELWYNISKERILPTDGKDLFTRSFLLSVGAKSLNFIKKYVPKALEAGSISRSGLIEIIDNYLDFDKILKSDITCYAACTEVEGLSPKYFRINDYDKQEIKNILLATSALPMIYESAEVSYNKYLDGGMADNVPVQPVYGEGCDIIIVVNLAKLVYVNKRLYPNTKFIEINPTVIEDGLVDGVLDFSPENSRRRSNQGYEDTMELFSPFIELFNELINDKGLKDALENEINKLGILKRIRKKAIKNKILRRKN